MSVEGGCPLGGVPLGVSPWGCPLGGVPLGVVAFSGRGEALDGDVLAALLDLPQIVGHLHAEPSFGC